MQKMKKEFSREVHTLIVFNLNREVASLNTVEQKQCLPGHALPFAMETDLPNGIALES